MHNEHEEMSFGFGLFLCQLKTCNRVQFSLKCSVRSQEGDFVANMLAMAKVAYMTFHAEMAVTRQTTFLYWLFLTILPSFDL